MNYNIIYYIFILLNITYIYCNESKTYRIYYDDNNKNNFIIKINNGIKPGILDNEIGTLTWTPPELHSSHFGTLSIETNNAYSDNIQMYSAGYLEGYATGSLIYDMARNMYCQENCNGTCSPSVAEFFDEQDIWTEKQMALHPNDNYWKMVDSIKSQYDGLIDGYHANYGQEYPLDIWAFRLINGMGDLFEIIPAVDDSRRPDFDSMTVDEIIQYWNINSHCSALIKVTDGFGEIFQAHSSWFTYSAMNRIFKYYNFNLHNEDLSSTIVSFSSYPGTLSSLDDFYMMNSGLGMTQTTNGIYNQTLYDLVTPYSLLAWQRVQLSNRLASTGKEWYQYFRQHNSGTYTNQYMIINYNLWKPNQGLNEELLWVIEQTPGLVFGQKKTEILERGYWASYNVPALSEAYIRLGYAEVDKKDDTAYGTQYDLAPRASIFRRIQSNVQDIEGMQYVMRYNEYETDKFADGSAWNAICSRGDLADPPSANGCYDSKVTSGSLFKSLQAYIINGPTNQNQPTFSWSNFTLANSTDHYGEAETFDFSFELVEPDFNE